ncbi:MAG: hypothetical protein WAQ53_02775 [Thiofilum sp.]|uniref:LysM peptidoglycan-binding domain-containing protein n=1 Tax=Thiofilum sp. TaxID=2212733 RepID=UPI0025CD902D|nr:hypothetical protein [Thiofilum sp.]MBK8454612.1 hypothetical protein [Thiofilum sp.]
MMKTNSLRIGCLVLLSLLVGRHSYAEETSPSVDKLLNAAESLMVEEQKPTTQNTSTEESLLNSAAALMQQPQTQGQPAASVPSSTTETSVTTVPEPTPQAELNVNEPSTATHPAPSATPVIETEILKSEPQPEPQPEAQPTPQPEPESTPPPATETSEPPKQSLLPELPTPEPENAAEVTATENAPRSYGVMLKQKNAEGQEVTYFKVEEGASLSAIAGQIYQDPMKFRLIYEANKEQLTSPDRVAAGALLIIPPLE